MMFLEDGQGDASFAILIWLATLLIQICLMWLGGARLLVPTSINGPL